MASLAFGQTWQPRTLTDRLNGVTTIKRQPSVVGLTRGDIAGMVAGNIDLVVESGDERRCVRFAIPSLPGPRWLNQSILSLGKLLALANNWDREGAPPIDSTAIQTAIDALCSFMSDNSSLPQWTPTQRSGVQLEWHENGIDLEIAFEPGDVDGYAVFDDRNHPGTEWDGPVEGRTEELMEIFRHSLTL